MPDFMDLTGQTFGRLTVVERADNHVYPSGRQAVMWRCKCSCEDNKYVIVPAKRLRSGKTRSCGCLHNELLAEMRKKYNTYDLSGEYGIGYDCNNKKFYFDLEDYDKIKDYCWVIGQTGYVMSYTTSNNRKRILLHRLVMDCNDSNLFIDHIHGNQSRNDDRKSNLRIVTPSQNMMNKSLARNNISGVTGVSFIKNECKWCAQIRVNNKQINLGHFDSFEDAVKARKDAEEKYFGEYSYDNSQS